MIRKNSLHKVVAFAVAAVSLGMAAQTINLPTIKMQGKEYYYYKVKKSDSPYGICKTYGWNEDTLRAVNADMGTKIAKGKTIYYPVNTGIDNEMPVIGRIEKVKVTPEPIVHTVTRGETIYSISKLYSVPVDLIYSSNPEARHGLKTGDKLTIIQPVYEGLKGSSPFFYTVRQGDTLTQLAQQYNTDVASIMSENPGMSERTLTTGENIRIIPNNRKTTQVTETREITTVSGFSPYKIVKGDTWESIATAHNVTTEALMQANDAKELPKKGSWIVIPQYKSEVKQTVIETPVMAESTVSERDAIYQTIHRIDSVKQVEVAVVLDKPSAKNNSEFLRGFLMGIDDQKTSGTKIHLNVIDASKGISMAGADSLLTASNLIVGVYDSEFPSYLAEIGNRNGIEVVNVLDSKSTLYEGNPSIIQILQPIDYFNDLTAGYIKKQNPNSQLILLGDIDTTDRFADKLTDEYSPEVTTRLSAEEFAVYPFSPTDTYVVYSFALKKDDIANHLTLIADAQQKGTPIVPVGRAQWVAYAQPLGEQYGATNLLVPSRMYISPYDQKQTAFANRFKGIYHANPAVSYPQYAMLGYDIASYFIPTTAGNGGDYNTGVYMRPGLQNDIDIKRLNNWSGFINTNGYILHYLPAQIVEKIEIK